MRALSRRHFLSTAALGAVALSATACTSAQIAQFQEEWATVVGKIQGAVATAAKYVPTIESVAATAASLFGPTYTALVVAGSAAFNQVVQTLINVVGQLTPPAAARLSARLRVSSQANPVSIGTTAAGVPVAGWRAVKFGHRHR